MGHLRLVVTALALSLSASAAAEDRAPADCRLVLAILHARVHLYGLHGIERTPPEGVLHMEEIASRSEHRPVPVTVSNRTKKRVRPAVLQPSPCRDALFTVARRDETLRDVEGFDLTLRQLRGGGFCFDVAHVRFTPSERTLFVVGDGIVHGRASQTDAGWSLRDVRFFGDACEDAL
jgi:hypothetical protein